jgi:DNA adenine methylase
MVREQPGEVAAALRALAAAHTRAGAAHYYVVRDERFNPLRAERRLADGCIRYTPELAAMLIYLNRTGFNGLFRVNARGQFNVPAGRYARPRIEDDARLRAVAAVLAQSTVRLEYGSFSSVLDVAARGDFIYVDPPYAPLSPTASFTSYTPGRFSQDDQVRLQETVIALARRGCHVLLSNSTADAIAVLYDGNRASEAAGLRAWRVPARRAVNSVASRRGAIEEYLISNVGPRDAIGLITNR